MKVGIDIVEVSRIADMVERFGTRFVDKVFTPAEAAYAAGRRRMPESLAGRFAAKEAFMKALGRKMPWQDVEVVMRDGKPSILCCGRPYGGVSISHERDYAVAMVVMEEDI
jgi:holo-[acyl-carrier protein] synthase